MGIRIGMVGLGQFGSQFVGLFALHPLVDKLALCDAEPSKLKVWADCEELKSKLSPKDFYTSFDEICRADLDALVIITQPWLHAPQCIQALESGKCVYSAVPIISLPNFDETLDVCGKLVETVKRTGKHYMLGETAAYVPHTMFCRRMARAKEFGDFVFAEAEYIHDLDDAKCSLRDVQKCRTSGKIGSQAEATFRKYAESGFKTSPMDYPTHSCCGPLYVMNARARKVSAVGYRNTNNDPYFRYYEFSNVTGFFHLDNGVALRVTEGREGAELPGWTHTDFRVYGTKGSYSLGKWSNNGRTVPDGEKHPAIVRDLTDAEMRDPLSTEIIEAFKPHCGGKDIFHTDAHGGSHVYLVHEFVSAVAADRIPEIDVWFSAHLMAMGCAAHKSALRDGELLDVCDFGAPHL